MKPTHRSSSLDALEIYQIKEKNKRTDYLTIINQTCVMGFVIVPYFIQCSGVILGSCFFALFFGMSFIESTLLCDLKCYARSRLMQPTLDSVFKLLRIPIAITDLYRVIAVVNFNLYVVLLLMIFGDSIHYIILLYNSDAEQQYRVVAARRFLIFLGAITLIPIYIKWKYQSITSAYARLISVVAFILITFAAYFKGTTRIQVIFPQQIVPTFTALPVLVLQFSFHQQFFSSQLKNRITDESSISRLKQQVFCGSLALMILELMLGILAAQAFNHESTIGTNLLSMVFNLANFTAFSCAFYILISLACLMMITQYVTSAVEQLIFIIDKPTDQEVKMLKKKTEKLKVQNQRKPLIYASCFYGTAVVISMALPPIILISCLIGTMTQNALTFLIPSLLYLNRHFKSETTSFKYCFAWFGVAFSIIFGITSLMNGLYALYQGYD